MELGLRVQVGLILRMWFEALLEPRLHVDPGSAGVVFDSAFLNSALNVSAIECTDALKEKLVRPWGLGVEEIHSVS